MVLKESEITKNVGINLDPAGFVFKYDNRLFRAISPEKEKDFRLLIESGAINELVKANLIPDTKISEFQLEGYGLVLEHQKIEVVTYPTEWSFSMFKDAALLVIRLNRILLKFGYETRDSHGFNILFDNCTPKFVDLGSFGRKRTRKFWRGYNDFRVYFLNSLRIWSNGNSFIARKLTNSGRFEDGDYEYFIYKHPFFRIFPQLPLRKYFFYSKHLRNLPDFDIDNMLIVRKPEMKRKVLKLLFSLSNMKVVPNSNVSFDRLERRVSKIGAPTLNTRWGNYHTDLENRDAFESGGRFDTIIELLKKYRVREVLEIGGNQGLLSREISEFIPKVICSDYDEVAVDSMYLKAKREKSRITPVLLDFLRPIFKALYDAEAVATTRRLRSETVLALALTHHLIIKQNVPIDEMFNALSKYLNRFLFVEFMPRGIDKNPVPSWYNIHWFRSNFSRYFKLLEEIPTVSDGSRILLVGERL